MTSPSMTTAGSVSSHGSGRVDGSVGGASGTGPV
jgi:hypothetical protein